MAGVRRKYQVFVSSTKKDLSDEREEVTWELLKAGFIPVGMENFSATDDRGWETISEAIDESDYYVVIVAGWYGSTDDTGKSWTQREYEYARQKGIPVFAFLRDMQEVRAPQLEHDPKKAELLHAFRDALRDAHLCEEWKQGTDLRGQVAMALQKAFVRDESRGTPRPGWYRGPAPDLTEFAALSAENRELRARVAAMHHQNPAVERLKSLKKGTILVISGVNHLGNSYGGEYPFEAVDEEQNVVRVRSSSGYVTYPLDKVDTVYPIGTTEKYRLAIVPFG